MDAAARRRTYDIPKSDSVGLTEWTSKIKALQRQVDEDEEAETKRLEEEIMASRMSRMRRSTLQPRPLSHDSSANKFSRVASPASEINHSQSAEDKQRDREATMRKLMGQRSPVMPSSPRPKASPDSPSLAPPKPSSSANKPRQEPTSLAAFMGSRETGPRMDKHAPQQDVHDPAQFEQRRSITSPHPAFGMTGVAMPGLVPRSPGPQPRTSPRLGDVEMVSPIQPISPLNLRERKISTPTIARRYVENVESESSPKPPPSPRFRDTREHMRGRTMSTPSGPGPSLQRYTNPPNPPPSSLEPTFMSKQSSPLPQLHNSLSTSSTPNLHRHSYTPRPLSSEVKPDSPRRVFPSVSQPGRTETQSLSRPKSPILPISTPNLRRSPSPSTTSTSLSRPAATVKTPTLSRPVEPKPNPSLRGTNIVSFNRSPAFSDRTPSKGVTPSLSRLQGRGFVQNMVKASANLESSTGPSPAHTPERARLEPQKKTSVLDRWPGTGSATSTPVVPAAPILMRKAKTFDPVSVTISGSHSLSQPPPAPQPISTPKRRSQTFEKGLDATPPLSKLPSKGILVAPREKEKPLSITPPATSSGHTAGVGSSNTLVSYIKPMKTGDSEPPTPVRSKTPTATDGADELGIRKRKSSGKLREKSVSFAASPPRSKAKSAAVALPSPGKSLSHPTKDRAKKPKRVKITAVVAGVDKQSTPTSRTEVPPSAVNDFTNSSGVPLTSILPTPPLPKQSSPSQDLPPPSPTTLVPPSSDPQYQTPVSVRSLKSRSPSPQPSVRSPGKGLPPKGYSPPTTQPKVADRRGNVPIISVKPVLNGKGHPSSSSLMNRGNPRQTALPGLSIAIPSPRGADKVEDRAPLSPTPTKEPPQEKARERNSGEKKFGVDKPQQRRPPVPHKPSRIPSTGNRATVMDVAQVWSQHEKHGSQDVASPRSTSPNSPLEPHPVWPVGIQAGFDHQRERERENQEQEEPPKLDAGAAIAGCGIHTSAPAPSAVVVYKGSEEGEGVSLELPEVLGLTGKGKSSWEKYSEFIMPALEEEWTPEPSPIPTLNNPPEVAMVAKELIFAPIPEAKRLKESKVDYLQIDLLSTTLNPEGRVVKVSPTDLITFDFPNYAVPKIDARLLLELIPKPTPADLGATTVSVDVLSIVGSVSSAINSDTNVFYDTEILAIIQRVKVKSSGLVDTKVWGWIGKDAKVNPKEEKALTDLAKRYGTKLDPVKQHHEPVDMVTALGGTLAIRQGSRAHWSSENTTMHLVRSTKDAIFIDEQHLSVQSLCSGFSYCLSILQMFYVWNGRGARSEERKAAFDYTVGLCGDTGSVIVLDEGESDDDEMFWAVLGDGNREYAKASHWKWRASVDVVDPQIWKISASQDQQFTHIPAASNASPDDGVFILDTTWEVFVLVGADSRGKREDIRLALTTAKALAFFVGPSRPFVPPIHVLVFPSQVPQDVRFATRGIDFPGEGEAVEHMNILSASQALDHLNARQWPKVTLSNKALLPLGLSPDDLH